LLGTALIDRDGCIRSCDAGFASALGLSPEAVVRGRRVGETLEPAWEAALERGFGQVRESGEVVTLRRPPWEIFLAPQPAEAGEGDAIWMLVRPAEALTQGDETCRAIFDSASEGMVVASEDGRIVRANRTAEQLFGCGAGELAGLPIEDLLPEQLRPAHRGYRAGFFAAPRVRPMGRGIDLRARRKDGSEFPVEISLSFAETTAGRLAIAFITDISHRRQLEDERQQFFNLSADLNCVAGADGYFKQVNAAFERVLGWSAHELLARPFFDFIHPEDREASRRTLHDLTQGRPAVQFVNRYLCKDGSYRWLSWSTPAPRPGSEAFFASARDITADRIAQAERQRLITLIETSGDLIGLVSTDGQIEYLNGAGCAMAGYASLEEARGKPIAEVFGGGAMLLALALDGRWRGEDSIRNRRTGEAFALDVNAFAMETGDRKMWAMVAHDVRRRKRDQERLQALTAQLLNVQEDERRRVARELHDDITQKLAMMGIELGLIHREMIDVNRAGEHRLAGVHEQVMQLSEDVRQLSHQLHPSVLEHSGLGPALEAFCREIAKQTGIAVTVTLRDVPHALPRPVGTGLYRIAQEALRNVAKHSGASAASVTLSYEAGMLRLAIIDDGKGFDVSLQDANPGIGMVSMRERTRLIDGRLAIESEPGEGTRLTVEVRVGE